MLSQNSYTESPITHVNFAGFRSSTYELSRNGWAISAYERVCESTMDHVLQLSMKHEGGMVLMSSAFMTRYDFMTRTIPKFELKVTAASIDYKSCFFHRPQPIEIEMNQGAFLPIDVLPKRKEINLSTLNFEDFCIFRPLNDSATIYVPKATEAELMKMILDKQAPKQDIIREKRKRESLRDGGISCERTSIDFIKAQIIAI